MDSQVNRNEILLVSSGLLCKPSLPSVSADNLFISGSGNAASAVLIVIKQSSECPFYHNQQGAFLFFLDIQLYWGRGAICFRKATALGAAIGVGVCISRF